jgi:hypothetical protein
MPAQPHNQRRRQIRPPRPRYAPRKAHPLNDIRASQAAAQPADGKDRRDDGVVCVRHGQAIGQAEGRGTAGAGEGGDGEVEFG